MLMGGRSRRPCGPLGFQSHYVSYERSARVLRARGNVEKKMARLLTGSATIPKTIGWTDYAITQPWN